MHSQLPPVEEEFGEDEDVYNERGDENNNTNNDDEYDEDGANWEENQGNNADSGDMEDGEV